jgi:hypothetical protein
MNHNIKEFLKIILLFIVLLNGEIVMAQTCEFVSASHPYIQYFGRWDMRDSNRYYHSWPGVYWQANFTGTSIGVRMADSVNYYNVYIDGRLHSVFHGTKSGEADTILAENLQSGIHTIRLSKRNIVFDAIFSFSGFILSPNGKLLPPSEKPKRKIEFVGNSFTVAESNEAAVQELPWEERYPVTNTDKGFAAMIARYYNAQYHITARSGSGMVCDWSGDTTRTIPVIFDRTLMEAPEPVWDFSRWIPDVVVVCLGLNDYSGLHDSAGNVSEEKSRFFREGYHTFLSRLRRVYPQVKFVAVAAFPAWIRQNVKQIVEEECAQGNSDVIYATFDEFPGGYVANGHPTVATHEKMAKQIIETMEQEKIFND